jgi:hypothetical protein
MRARTANPKIKIFYAERSAVAAHLDRAQPGKREAGSGKPALVAGKPV